MLVMSPVDILKAKDLSPGIAFTPPPKDGITKSVMLLRPLTCHIPVSPGLVARRAR